MSTTGKVFLIFNILLGFGAIYFIGGYVSMRNAWLEKVEKAEKTYLQNKESTDQLVAEYNKAASDMARLRKAWGRGGKMGANDWTKIGVAIKNKNQGIISTDLGFSKGLTRAKGATQNPLLYAFQPRGDHFVYVGEFEATSINLNNSELKITRPLKPKEGDTWEPGTWRFRDRIPSGELVRFSAPENRWQLVREQLADRIANIEVQTQLSQTATDQLDGRLRELNGDPDADPLLGEVTKEGLVKSLRTYDDRKNKQLAELDQLRLILKFQYDKLERLVAENQALAQKLEEQSVAGENSQAASAAKTEKLPR